MENRWQEICLGQMSKLRLGENVWDSPVEKRWGGGLREACRVGGGGENEGGRVWWNLG